MIVIVKTTVTSMSSCSDNSRSAINLFLLAGLQFKFHRSVASIHHSE